MPSLSTLFVVATLAVPCALAALSHSAPNHLRRATPNAIHRRRARPFGKRSATLKCTSTLTFQICDDDGVCTDMGTVADGTVCQNDTITWSDGTPTDAVESSSIVQSIDSAYTSVAPSSSATTAAATTTTSQWTPAATTTTQTTSVWSSSASWSESASRSATTTATTTQAWTTSTAAATTSSSSSAAAAATSSSSSSSSSSGQTYTGTGTWYQQEGAVPACGGSARSDSDKIVALAAALYDSGDYCNKEVQITNTANQKVVTATVVDRCAGCATEDSVDMSQGTFDELGSESTGTLDISWSFAS